MTYQLCPIGLSAHQWKLKKVVTVTVIRNVLHPDLVKGKLFVVKLHTIRWSKSRRRWKRWEDIPNEQNTVPIKAPWVNIT